jgi:hypothetical protein
MWTITIRNLSGVTTARIQCDTAAAERWIKKLHREAYLYIKKEA